MSDFSRGLLSGLAGSNGIAGAIRNWSMAPYLAAIQAQRARSDAAVQALNEAKLAEMNRNREGLEASRNYLARHMGIDPAALQGATDYGQLLPSAQKLQMMGAAGMFDRGPKAADTLPVTGAQMLAGTDPFEEARAVSEANIKRNTAFLKQLLQDTGAMEHSLKGGSMYQYQNNGAAFNPFDGTVTVADPEVRNLYRQKTQADITKSRTQAAKAARSGGGSSNAGWQIKQTAAGETVRVNARTGEIVPLGTKLKFGKGNDEWSAPEEKKILTANGSYTVSELRQQATEAMMNGANEGAAKRRFKELTGEDY